MKEKRKQAGLFAVWSLILILLDQWTKHLAVSYLKGQPPFVLIDGVFELLYSENRGAAFSILQGKQGFLFLITLAVLVFVGYALVKMPANRRYLPLTVCLNLLFAGAVGNMIDRVTNGFVVDFLYFSLIDFPIFNVADIYVTTAAALFLILMLWYYKEEELEVFSFKKQNGKTE
ncbi:MAG: signal peptidase II [Lachnospiraceae bacterium]|jgi:signal peptidase II